MERQDLDANETPVSGRVLIYHDNEDTGYPQVCGCVALHGIAWYCMVVHGIAWYCMVVYNIS